MKNECDINDRRFGRLENSALQQALPLLYKMKFLKSPFGCRACNALFEGCRLHRVGRGLLRTYSGAKKPHPYLDALQAWMCRRVSPRLKCRLLPLSSFQCSDSYVSPVSHNALLTGNLKWHVFAAFLAK